MSELMAFGTYGPGFLSACHSTLVHVTVGGGMNAAATERMVHASPTHFFGANDCTLPRRIVISAVAGIDTAIDWRGGIETRGPMARHTTLSFWSGLVYPSSEKHNDGYHQVNTMISNGLASLGRAICDHQYRFALCYC